MLSTHAVITVKIISRGESHDLEVPLDISAGELCSALYEMYSIQRQNNMQQFFLRAERPIALLRGQRSLRDYGIRDGTIINL